MQDYYQMTVEECGNMILCVAALCKAENCLEYAKKHQEILTGWADYLVSVGWDPENQLCTDDFAGHLAVSYTHLDVYKRQGVRVMSMRKRPEFR